MISSLDASLKNLNLSSDVNAQIYALLDQDKFAESLKLAESTTSKQVSKLYVAYAQYRLGREDQCLETLGDAKDRASLHLRAQALYRLEKVSTNELELLKKGFVVENEEADIAVNEMAVAAQHAYLSKSVDNLVANEQDASHEYLFNYALYLTSNGRTEEAISVLKNAVTALENLHIDESDYDAEVAPIEAQLALLTSDASLNQTARERKCDSTTEFLTSINFLEDDNPFILHKAYYAENRLRPSARLFSFQDRFVAFDRIVVMHSIGLNIKKAVRRYVAKYAEIDEQRCASLMTLLYSKHTTQSLREILMKEPENVDVVIALISKSVRQPKGVSKCLKILEDVPEAARSQSPGLVGLHCALSDLTPQSRSSAILKQALKSAEGQTKIELLAGAIQRSLARPRSTSAEDATAQAKTYLDELLQLDPTNLIAQSAKLVLDPSRNNEIIQLPDMSAIDVAGLELNNKKRPAEESSSPRAAVKKQKSKTPEQLEQEQKLDPERWLPKRDRSTYKPTKKDKQRAKGGHQGGIVDESLSTQGPASLPKTGEVQRKKKNKKGKK